MRIGITAGPSLPVPPFAGYGGIERGTNDLALGLADRGHEVMLLAPSSSTISHPNIVVVPTGDTGIYEDRAHPPSIVEADELKRDSVGHMLDAFATLSEQGRLDTVNVRWENPDLVTGLGHLGIKHVVSISCTRSETVAATIAARNSFTSAVTAHTEAHRRNLDADDLVVARYGINVDTVPFSRHDLGAAERPILPDRLGALRGSFLLHLANIAPFKGQRTSIEIARRAGLPLVLAGNPSRMNDVGEDYFKEVILPLVDGERVVYVGNADEEFKYELMGLAHATLFCSGYEDPSFSEPFGRVLAESLATGTPVVGYNYGSFPELVKDGVAGFGFNDIDGAVSAVRRLGDISRVGCRDYAQQNLSQHQFVDDMEALLLESARSQVAA